jgi:SM-20-related protein
VNRPDLFVVEHFFKPLMCEALVAEMKAAEASAATVYGRTTSGSVDSNVRKTLRVTPSSETLELVMQRLLCCKPAVEKHFNVSLSECEEAQFLRYREGDFFVAHQDGNTGLLRLDTERRLISTVIFLNRQSESAGPDVYCGGSLLFTRHGFHMSAEPGTLVAFRSETTHEVTPVTHGERFSIASWYM